MHSIKRSGVLCGSLPMRWAVLFTKYYLKEMRLHHFVKNLLILAPLMCNRGFFDIERLFPVLIGVLCFTLTASSVYVINDICDIKKDQKHPVKCRRPIASGKIPLGAAIIFAVFLVAASLILNITATGHASSSWFLVIYLVMNVAYSLKLKDIPIVDIFILSLGFLIRVLYGGMVADITVSNWLYLTVLTAAFFFSIGKRRNELRHHLKNNQDTTRPVLRYYTADFLNQSMYVCMGMTNVFYALWGMSPETEAWYHGKNVIWTLPLVMFITFRYVLDIEGDSEGDPVSVLLHDPMLILMSLIYILCMIILLYF